MSDCICKENRGNFFLFRILLGTCIWFLFCPLWAQAKENVESAKGLPAQKGTATLTLPPGQCVSENLSQGDSTFGDGTLYDLYYLEWPGGDLTVTLDSPVFDEYLIVVDPLSQRTDVDQSGTQPEVFNRFGATAGTYAVYANSFVFATGSYQLCANVSTFPTPTPSATKGASPTPTQCLPPPAAVNPNPPDGQAGLALNAVVSWNSLGGNKVIYGADNRLDIYQVQDSEALAAADSTAMLVRPSKLTNNGDGTYTLDATTFNQDSGGVLCADEPYRNQPSPGHCSGFLVGPDLVATAGHCVTTAADCTNTAVVFGFDMLNAVDARIVLPEEDVYFCNGLVQRRQVGDEDWALIRLDREVLGRAPLPIRREGKIPDNRSVTVIGHPVGLPKKIAGGANVRTNSNGVFFVANLDTYGGNSGSPVFDTDTWTVEGVLVRGENDFVSLGGCTRSMQCEDNACQGEDCTRTTQFSSFVPEIAPQETYDIYFGPCGNLVYQGMTAEISWTLPTLAEGTQYCWQVVTKSACGATSESPIWSFTTQGAEETGTATATATPAATETPTPSETSTPSETPAASETPTATSTDTPSLTPTEIATALDARADINQDRIIDQADLLLLMQNWMRKVNP